MRIQHLNSKVLTLSILLFSCYACENNPVKTDSKIESHSDSTIYKTNLVEPNHSKRPTSASSIFMTFFHGMSSEQFEAEREHLVSEGLLIKLDSIKSVAGHYEIEIDNIVVLFEPVEGAKLRLQPRFFTKNDTFFLNSVELTDRNSSEKVQNKILAIYKEKYGEKFTFTRDVDNFGYIYGNFAGKVISNNYSWQQNDGKKIELTLSTMSRDYKPREDRPAAAGFLLIGQGFKKDDWIKIPSIVTRETYLEYLPKEAIERENIKRTQEKEMKEDEEFKKRKRLQKNANNI